MNTGFNTCTDTCSERKKLLIEISKVDFVLKELNLYLDIHLTSRPWNILIITI